MRGRLRGGAWGPARNWVLQEPSGVEAPSVFTAIEGLYRKLSPEKEEEKAVALRAGWARRV